jgi:hypothetical protein
MEEAFRHFVGATLMERRDNRSRGADEMLVVDADGLRLVC